MGLFSEQNIFYENKPISPWAMGKFFSTKFNAKSIGDNFKIVAYLVLNRFAKNNDFFAYTT
jgi:hypothetical protein